MLATSDDIDPQVAVWDEIDLINSDKMAIPSRQPGWVVTMLGGDLYWLSADSARRLSSELAQAGHTSHHESLERPEHVVDHGFGVSVVESACALHHSSKDSP